MVVTVERVDDQDVEIQTYVSLSRDRQEDDGGYRLIVDVLSDKLLRKELLDEALSALKRMERKYREMSELAPVFAAIRRVKKSNS